jgi:hypothetical protein
MKCDNATKFHRKSGVAEWRDLRFFLGSHANTWNVSFYFSWNRLRDQLAIL